MTDREFATDVVARLQAAGFRALWAGGCVRDELLGLAPDDYDIASDARPDDVKGLFRRCLFVGASFGVVEVLGPKKPNGDWHKVQVATFRSDGTYTDGRRPDAVTFSSPEEDARRRDFTVNGLFFDPLRNEVFDYVGGRADLAAKVLRAIGNPAERFAEDKLRVLRAVRMAARFELAVDPPTLAEARRMASQITAVSPERIGDELRKVLTNRHRGRGVRLLREFGLVEPLVPEIASDFDNIAGVVAALAGPVTVPLGFAALLHRLPAKTVADVGKRVRLSNAELDRLLWLVAHQRFPADADGLPPSRRNPVLVHPGAGELLALARALGETAGADFCDGILRETPVDVLNPPPLLTGDDLRGLGLTPGPRFKAILDAVRAAQLDGEIADRAGAEALALRMAGG